MSKNYVPEQLHLIPGIETCCMVSKYRESANLKLKHSEEVYGKLIDHIPHCFISRDGMLDN